ncbi:DUF5947 family protein [Streptomyces viridochromogenes]|uniref:Uncharacterized protein n=1 Tax=Streptomyces viridochromogenes Tue57 TaxID=1160705 RepID=L8P6G1_STRVR|nr:DUF5947 family protein [Streptomyces viridochromogenes]ELS50917.1 hypothetical protein STVIR_8140 [Streptomyces viridochromogenes Tue57]
MTADGALARMIRSSAGRRTGDAEERCDLCGAPIAADHRHLYDTGREEMLCACRACSVLFVEDGAGDGHYRLVPQRRVRLPEIDTEPLGVPVGLAFFVPRADGTVSAHYPSPAGATRWEVDAGAWRRAVATCPQLAGVEPEVEALLVNTARSLRHHWIVPVDDCFRLVALVRREWRGLSGGGRLWPAIEGFFTELRSTA